MLEFTTNEKLKRIKAEDEIILARFRREGEKLGLQNLPKTETVDLSKIEADEVSKTQTILNEFKNEVTSFREKTKRKIDLITTYLDNENPTKQSETLEKFEANLNTIENEYGPGSAIYENTINQLNEAKNSLSEVKNSLGNRELQIGFAHIYWPFMFCLAFAEVAVNRLAFELFFEGSPFSSLLLAIAVGGMLVFFSHITGSSIKHSLIKNKFQNTNTFISLFFLNSLVGFFVFYLAKMRQAFVSLTSSQDLSLTELINTNENALIGETLFDSGTLGSLISANIGEEGFFLLLVNVVVYVAGTVAAILRHDAHPDYEKLVRKVTNLSDKSMRLKRKYQLKYSELANTKQSRLNTLQSRQNEKQNELRELETNLHNTEGLVEAEAVQLANALNKKINAFRNSCSKTRTDQPPKYFKNKVSLDI